MSFVSARATRTAASVVALSGAGLWALCAMDAKADPPPLEESRPCAEGRALFAAKLAYLAIAPNLTAAQRDILSRNIVPPRHSRSASPVDCRFWLSLSAMGHEPGLRPLRPRDP